jgi:hypothetical protein
MALTPSSVTRELDTTGTSIASYVQAGKEYQAVSLSDHLGTQTGVLANPLKTVEVEPALYADSIVLENTNQAKASAGVLREATVVIDSAIDSVTPYYLHVYNLVGAPAGSPVLRAFIPPGGQVTFTPPSGRRTFSTGILVAVSSTLLTFTSPGSARAVFHVGMD